MEKPIHGASPTEVKCVGWDVGLIGGKLGGAHIQFLTCCSSTSTWWGIPVSVGLLLWDKAPHSTQEITLVSVLRLRSMSASSALSVNNAADSVSQIK